MAEKQVPALAPDPETGRMRFGLVNESEADALVKAGGKLLTAKEAATAEAEIRQTAREEKAGVAGKISTVLGAAGGAINPLLFMGGPGSMGEAYNRGVVNGLTAGASDVAIKKGLDATVGRGAGAAFAQQTQDIKLTNGGAHTAGQVAGMLAGSALPMTPAGAIGAVGNVAEQAAARGLAGVAGRGVLGRALASAGELGARGVVEGALYGAANQVTEDVLGDREVAADKVFAAAGHGALYGGLGGAALGGAGSLAKSAVVGTVNAARGGLARAMSRAETAAAEGTEALQNAGRAIEKEAPAARSMLSDLASTEGQKGLAYDQAWAAIGRGFGLQTTGFAGKANRYLPNGTRDVGEVLMRKGILNAEDGMMAAVRGGTPADMLPKISAERAIVGQQIGELTQASPARVSVEQIAKSIDDIAKPYEGKAGQRHIGESVRAYGDELRQVLGLTEPGQTVAVQDLLAQRKALDELVFQETKALDPKMRVQALRDLRGKLEGTITDAIDEAGGQLKGELAAQYKALKKDFFALSIAEDAATDSAARMAKGKVFSLTDTIAGAGRDGVVSGLASAAVHKALRERGNAAAAVLLHRMADMGALSKVVRSVDDQIARSSRGLLAAPAKRPLPETPQGTPRARAEAAADTVRKWQADPEGFADTVARQTEAMSVTAPEVSGGVARRMTDALTFLASKMPSGPPPDPLDPKPQPKMTDAEAAKFARYAWYVERPSRFFEEVEHGRLTLEGVEVARTLMPGAFAEMQARTAEGLATLAAQGRKPPFQQRATLGVLLDFPAVPAQRPEHMRFLQANATLMEQLAKQGGPKGGGGGGTGAAAKAFAPASALDRLTEKGPGRR